MCNFIGFKENRIFFLIFNSWFIVPLILQVVKHFNGQNNVKRYNNKKQR